MRCGAPCREQRVTNIITIAELAACCEAAPVVLPDPAVTVAQGYASDLLSDVMAHAPDQSVLITVQNHRNTVAVATLVGARAILVCHDRTVPEEMAQSAAAERVAILRTRFSQFEASCRVAAALTSQGKCAGPGCVLSLPRSAPGAA
jgi:hypothetical protein